MRIIVGLATFATIGGALMVVASAVAQPPGRPDGGRGGGGGGGGPADATGFINRMLTLDANQDGQLSKDEVTDPRLMALFERADTIKDGVVTKEELKTAFDKESAGNGQGGPGGRGPEGGGPGGPEGRGPGGPGGPGGQGGPGGPGGPGMGGPPPIGQVMPGGVQEMLRLSNEQRASIAALQKDDDKRLAKILNADQKRQLEEMKTRGPGGPGGPEGFGPPPGGPGGPGGNRGRDGGPGGPPNGRPKRPPGT